MAMTEHSQLTVIGTNHKRAPIGVREQLWCRPELLENRNGDGEVYENALRELFAIGREEEQ